MICFDFLDNFDYKVWRVASNPCNLYRKFTGFGFAVHAVKGKGLEPTYMIRMNLIIFRQGAIDTKL